MRLQLPDAADAPPCLSASEEVAIGRARARRDPPKDPLRRWAELQLAKAGRASGCSHPDIHAVEDDARRAWARRRPAF